MKLISTRNLLLKYVHEKMLTYETHGMTLTNSTNRTKPAKPYQL